MCFCSQYLGRWYEYSNYFAFFQLFNKCVNANYSNTKVNGKPAIKVVNRGRNEKNNSPTEAIGTAEFVANDPYKRGRFIVNFDAQPFFGMWDGAIDAYHPRLSMFVCLFPVRASSPNYNVVDTDYETYAIVYNCSPKLIFMKSG